MAPDGALDQETLQQALADISERDADMARAIADNGPPPVWARDPGFATLVLMILEQQVSLDSARHAFARLTGRLGEVAPAAFLTLDDHELRSIGFSRQKTGYARDLADRIKSGVLDLQSLAALGDDDARSELMTVRGIGPWTADVYLMMVLRRPDLWPVGDVALRIAWKEVKMLEEQPDETAFGEAGEIFRPWRSVAARVLWHGYLLRRGRM